MITESEIIEIGKLGKPHGINGEINAYIDDNVDIERLRRIVLEIDGIFVPFFLNDIRTKRVDTVIMNIDGVENEREASELTNHIIYSLKADDAVISDEEDNPDDGLYAADLVGYTILSETGALVGRIIDVDLSTENALFVVERPDMTNIFIPIADEMITDINPDTRNIVMTLPEGLLDL